MLQYSLGFTNNSASTIANYSMQKKSKVGKRESKMGELEKQSW